MATEPMDTTTSNPTTTSQKSSTPAKRSHPPTQQHATSSKSLTLRSPPWSYIHLHQYYQTQSQTPASLDALTAHVHITSALNQFLGLHGAAVPIDILKLEGSDVWIRVPAGDRSAVVAAVGGWVGRGGEGWRVVGWSSWSAGAEGGRDAGREIFEN